MRELDFLEQPLNLGQDTFAKGKISFDRAEKVGEIIKSYFSLIDGYKIKETCIVATTALRDAENKDYILDQIRVKTGKAVRVLDDAEEKELIYKEMMKKLKEDTLLKNGRALMVYIGTGTLGVSLYESNSIPLTLNIRIGSLKLNEIMDQIQEQTFRSNIAIEEYLSTFANILSNLLPEKKAEFFIASGHEMDLIARLCGGEKKGEILYITRENFMQLYQQIKNNTAGQIAELYGLDNDDAEMLLSSMSIYYTLLDLRMCFYYRSSRFPA
jgi:exopolyphosphatase/guanosine-5'-triphosphate,3'-diphosphate pyrophosphatase